MNIRKLTYSIDPSVSWSEPLWQAFETRAALFMRQTINFDEINVSNCHVYYPVNTCIRIALISSLIDGFSRTNCEPWVHTKGVNETPLLYLAGASIKLSIER